MARTLKARLPRLSRTCSWVPWKNPISADLGKFRVIFFCILKLVNFAYSLESPHRGVSNENTQHTFMFKKMKKMSI